jgi:hypothetical protein
MERRFVYEALDTERGYQTEKWGQSEHEVATFIVFMEHHLQKARRLVSEHPSDVRALEELRKVTALGVACFEQHGVSHRDGPIKPFPRD